MQKLGTLHAALSRRTQRALGRSKAVKSEKVHLKQRDKHSIEIKFRYLIKTNKRKRKHAYNVSLFFFLPYSFNINPATYDRNTFYDEMKLYLRFNTPRLRLDKILDSEDMSSPLVRIENIVKKYKQKDCNDCLENYIYESKLLACIYRSLLRDKLLRAYSGIKANKKKRSNFTLKEIRKVAYRFHDVAMEVSAPEHNFPENIIEHTKMIDEYLSLSLERYLSPFLLLPDQSVPKKIERIQKIIRKEILHRYESGYPTVLFDQGIEREREEYIYREKMLKRYSSEVLFFDVHRRNTAKRVEHFLYSIAAGIAMVFATTASFVGQLFYGRLSNSLFVLLVLSYMAKDRIKDCFRDLFRKFIGSVFYDRRLKLYDMRNKKRMAVIKERTFFTSESKIDQKVLDLRKKGSFEKLLSKTAEESIFVYDKRMILRTKTLKNIHNRIRGLADINIIQLRSFLKHLSSQTGYVPTISQDGKIDLHSEKLIYHLNLIMKLESDDNVIYKRYRLIVDANGIVRIESPSIANT